MLPGRKDSVVIQLEQDTIYLHPLQCSDNIDVPCSDPTLKGLVVIDLAAARKVSRIRIKLTGTTAVFGGKTYESRETLSKELEVRPASDRLEKGKHVYAFEFIIPSSTAPTVRSKFGIVTYSLKAYVERPSLLKSLTSPVTPVWLIANPADPGDVPAGLEAVVQDVAGEVGPVALHLRCSHLTVACLVYMNVRLLSPPDMQILSISAHIAQIFTLQYADPKIGVVNPPRQRKTMFYIDESSHRAGASSDSLLNNIGPGASPPLSHDLRKLYPKPMYTVQNEKEWQFSRIVRIPDDEHVRPSTLRGTNTPLKIKHKFVVEIKYRREGAPSPKVLILSTDLSIASCCCLNESLLLPSYDSLAPPTTKVQPFHRRCLCNSSLSDLVRKHGKELEEASTTPRQPFASTKGGA